jgi:hypothetical protein
VCIPVSVPWRNFPKKLPNLLKYIFTLFGFKLPAPGQNNYNYGHSFLVIIIFCCAEDWHQRNDFLEEWLHKPANA